MIKLKKQFITHTPDIRLMNYEKPIIALTGGIATGKSTASIFLQKQGIKITCADSIIKTIYQQNDTISLIQKVVPQAIFNNTISFPKLREIFFTNPKIQKIIETHLFTKYPTELLKHFNNSSNQDFILYDIPLLFEKNIHALVDQSVCIYCSEHDQYERINKRDHTSRPVIAKIIQQQIAINKKKDMATYTLPNTGTLEELYAELEIFYQHFFYTITD